MTWVMPSARVTGMCALEGRTAVAATTSGLYRPGSDEFTEGIAITARRAARTEIPYAKYETRKFLPSVLIAHPGRRSMPLPTAHQHKLKPAPPEASLPVFSLRVSCHRV